MEDNGTRIGGVLVEEMREGAAGFRQVQEWVAEGRYREAAALLESLLVDPGLGRSRRAQLHSLACWLYDGPLEQSGPRAVLHGEEAVRLSTLLHDPWHRAEAQAHLTGARIHMGDLAGARDELGRLEADVAEVPGLLSDGERTLYILSVLLEAAGRDWATCLSLLTDLEPFEAGVELELIRAWANLQSGAPPGSVCFGLPETFDDPALAAERVLLAAQIAQASGAPVDHEAVAVARLRLSAVGRRDLLLRFALPERPEDIGGDGGGGEGQKAKPNGAQL